MISVHWTEIFPPGEPVMALPNWDNPRLLLGARGAGQRMRDSAFYPAHRMCARGYRWMLRLKAAALARDVRRSTAECWPLADFLRGIVDAPYLSAVRIGTPCAAHKWTLRICGRDGNVAAFVKWGESGSARQRLMHEHEILLSLPDGVGPKPLKLGVLGGGLALAIAPMRGEALSPYGRHTETGLADFLRKLQIGTPVPVDSHPGFVHFRHDAPAVIAQWVGQLSDRELPVVIQHGDLAPWNLFAYSADDAEAPSQGMIACDWEYGSMRGAAYLDAAYYWVQIARLMHRHDPESAMKFTISRLGQHPWPSLPARHAEALVALAAYDAWRLALLDGDSAAEPAQQWQRAIWNRAPTHARVRPRMPYPDRIRSPVGFSPAAPPVMDMPSARFDASVPILPRSRD